MKTVSLIGGIAGGALFVASALAAHEVPLDFTILRDGSEIGQHHVEFRRDGASLSVLSRGNVAVKIAFVTVYRYQQRRDEIWSAGALQSFQAWTDDDGAVSESKGYRSDGSLMVDGRGGKLAAAGNAVLGTYWNMAATVGATSMIDSESGGAYPVTVSAGETTTIKAGGREVMAKRYRIEGGLGRERVHDVWYDADGRWVRMEQIARDGSKIEFVLR